MTQIGQKKTESRIARLLESGIDDYKNRRYQSSMTNMDEVLKLDEDNGEARKYWSLSYNALARAEILRVIERQRKAEEDEALLTLLSDVGPESAKEQRRQVAVGMFNTYDDIQSIISNISVKFSGVNEAEASFSNMVTAVNKRTKQKSVIFQGVKTWSFRRMGGAWKIVGFK